MARVLSTACILAIVAPTSGWAGRQTPGAAKQEAKRTEARGPRVRAVPRAATSHPDVEPAELLAEARRRESKLEYEQVLQLTDRVIEHPAATVGNKLTAYWLRGAALVIVNRAIDAEQSFRVLLRIRPDFEPHPATPPKILAVFRKVQVEEKALQQRTRTMERARLVATLKLEGAHPERGHGGEKVSFSYRLRDPHGAVRGIRIQFRRAGEPGYSSLALTPKDGVWTGALPADWTASEADYTVQYFLETLDHEEQLLLRVASASAPLTLAMTAGQLDRSGPLYESPWLWVTATVAAAVLGVSSWLVVDQMSALPDGDVRAVRVPR